MRLCITESKTLEHCEGEPLACFAHWMQRPRGAERLLLVEFTLTAYWLDDKSSVSLAALYLDSDAGVHIAVTDGDLIEDCSMSAAEQYALWVSEHGAASYCFGNPLALSPLAIAKPWGQEIWYTGVEARGVCHFAADSGETPVPWLQAAVPDGALGVAGEALVLLKILDPVSEPVTGDLYFELHEEKQEVYVVTHVDPNAWPDGTGYIRMGFHPDKLQCFEGDNDAFRDAYLHAVKSYEIVRRKIDGLPQGEQVAVELKEKEIALRGQMDGFSHLLPLRTGDVVKVPLLTPHSLQHGVRTVEFQTPVYERKILSFAQKVLTQDHWDTKEAVAQMRLHTEDEPRFETLLQQEGLLVERIVDFTDFEVRRVCLGSSGVLNLPPIPRYGLVIVVEGEVRIAQVNYGPEQALILPLGWSGELTPAEPASPVVLLLALPRN